ncbi:MAG TPA: RNA 2',3'-cyclic phosphodiesterase [Firmicutes bacterium]|nr:RNA 2',3'-cyclic phosphodiesterase [Bacillota bacterium]
MGVESERVRTFAAIFPSPEVASELSRCIASLSAKHYDVKWVEPLNLHVTLRFFGEIEKQLLPQLEAAIQAACAGVEPFELKVEGVGTFPPKGTPRVIWAGLTEGSERLANLFEMVDTAIKPLGFPRERFTAHFTLGRVRSAHNLSSLKKDLLSLEGKQFGTFQVSQVKLMKSELSRSGPSYSELAHFYLS